MISPLFHSFVDLESPYLEADTSESVLNDPVANIIMNSRILITHNNLNSECIDPDKHS